MPRLLSVVVVHSLWVYLLIDSLDGLTLASLSASINEILRKPPLNQTDDFFAGWLTTSDEWMLQSFLLKAKKNRMTTRSTS